MANNTPEQRELRRRNVRLGLILASVVALLLIGFVVRRYMLLGH
ncbi:cytochrome oxidase small assembly protein [Ottowia pentelensis]|uniref:Cytochrome oxidase small assembly protein n=1 Tax=Ottowia pentelensis TaxID=511108 RepID=A0ABV6PV94_9BURK|nr:cytochrome oxidase small assembly protein [Ottowia sp.]